MSAASFASNSLLFMGQRRVEEMRREAAVDPFAIRAASRVIAQALLLASAPVLDITREPGRNVILPTARELFSRLNHLGVAAMLTGDNALRIRGVAEVLNAASFADWNPVHFLDTAEMATAVAIGLDWFDPLLSVAQRCAVEDAIVEKGLLPGLGLLKGGAFWVTATHNWNVVCCGGLIVAAVVMRQRRPELADAIFGLAVPALANGLSAFDAQGGYPEGPGYWEYATKYAVLALAALDHAGLSTPNAPGLAKTWRYGRETTARSGNCFDYGDTVLRPDRSPVLGWLAGLSGDPEAARWQRDAPGDPHPLDLIWLSVDPGATEASDTRAIDFPEAGISVLRRDSDGLYLGLKGGSNSVNHAHLDLGSFVLEWHAIRFVGELGRDDYSLPGYSDPAVRMGYFRVTTAGHATLLISGANQSRHARATSLGVVNKPGFLGMACSIDDETSALTRRRGIAVIGESIWIVDEVVASDDFVAETTVEWRAFTSGTVVTEGALARISVDGVSLDFRIVEPGDAFWQIGPAPCPDGEASNKGITLVRSQGGPRKPAFRICVAVTAHAVDSPGPAPASIGKWGLCSSFQAMAQPEVHMEGGA